MLGFGLVLVGLYFLPTILAAVRQKRNLLAIGALNFFLGWSFIGWIVALIWALSADQPLQQVINISQNVAMPYAQGPYAQGPHAGQQQAMQQQWQPQQWPQQQPQQWQPQQTYQVPLEAMQPPMPANQSQPEHRQL